MSRAHDVNVMPMTSAAAPARRWLGAALLAVSPRPRRRRPDPCSETSLGATAGRARARRRGAGFGAERLTDSRVLSVRNPLSHQLSETDARVRDGGENGRGVTTWSHAGPHAGRFTTAAGRFRRCVRDSACSTGRSPRSRCGDLSHGRGCHLLPGDPRARLHAQDSLTAAAVNQAARARKATARVRTGHATSTAPRQRARRAGADADGAQSDEATCCDAIPSPRGIESQGRGWDTFSRLGGARP